MSPADRAQALRNRLSLLRQEIEALEKEAEQMAAGAGGAESAASPDALARLRDDMQQILRAASASTALNLLLASVVRHGGRRAILFILRKGDLWAWSGLGPGGERLRISRLTLRPEESPALSSALQVRKTRRPSEPEAWAERAGGPAAGEVAAVPLLSADRLSGVLWFEAGTPPGSGSIEATECLVAAAGAALELIALKRPGPIPAGARMTADERALGASLPYALAEEAGASEEAGGAAPASGSVPAPRPDLARQHEDARRLARLLVSEIKLYNEDRVVLGRKARDLYQRLRDDIERSRQVYTERVSAEVRATTDYFQQELVASLAEGDESLLGPVPASTS